MLAFLRQTRPVRLAIFLLLAITAYRLWFSTRIELVPDEAYYWLWSKHLAASYRDKGPAVAWIIAVGTSMFGDTNFGIRFFAVVLSSGAAWLLFLLARRLYDDRVALWSLLVAIVLPLFAVGSLLMTIDPPSVFCWGLAALIFWKALHRDRTLDWLWLGLAIGAGFLAKFTNGVQAACIALFLAWSKEHRSLLLSRRTVLAGAAFLLAISPILWWNVQTGWVHAMALKSRSGVEDSFGIHPAEFFRFVGEQFGIISPLFMIGMAAAVVAQAWRHHTDIRTRFLLTQCVPLAGIFLFFSLNKAGKGNWTAPALITGIILMVVFWRDLAARRPAWRGAIITAFAVAFGMSLAMHDTSFLRLPARLDPMRRAQGWADFAAHVDAARTKYQAPLLIGNHYSQASMMAYYLPDRPPTYLPPETYGKTQFSFWPQYEVHPDTRALYVTTTKREPPPALESQFNKIELVEEFVSQHRGRPMTPFRIYLCTRN